MYCKTPVVSNITPNKDNAQVELIDNDKNGFIVKGGPISILKTVNYIINLEKQKKLEYVREKAKFKIKSNFSIKKSTQSLETYLSLYLNNSDINDFYFKVKKSLVIYPSIKEIDSYKNMYAIRMQNYQKINLNFIEKLLDIALLFMISIVDKFEDFILIIHKQ